ncbi:MAG: hypothetical protein NTW16_06050 [Bacteroidetes bacterium]|nr:hypothetical protein [Bacteroidota bacterium]
MKKLPFTLFLNSMAMPNKFALASSNRDAERQTRKTPVFQLLFLIFAFVMTAEVI